MSTTTNIEEFNKFTLYTLVALFDEFPVPIDIDASWIGSNIFCSDSDAESVAFDRMEFAVHSMSWLAEEGFISFVKQDDDVFLQVRLTLKGLTLLGYSIPNNDSRTLIDQAKEAIAEGAQGTVKGVISKLLTMAVFSCIGSPV